ncbi:hypothetical protein ES708_16473 [subsurface metagenome]
MSNSSIKETKSPFKLRMPIIITLFRRLPQAWEAFLWISLASLATNILSLVIPLYFMQVYDRVISNSSFYTLIWLTVGAVIVILIDTVITVVRGILSSWYASTFSHIEGLQQEDLIQEMRPHQEPEQYD